MDSSSRSRDGERAPMRIGSFKDVVGELDLIAIFDYLLDQSWQLYREENAPKNK